LHVGLEHIHNMFQISQLRKYVPDPNYAIITELIEVIKDLAYEEQPVQIVDRMIKQLCNKQIPLKVLWANHTSLKATWQTEDMKVK